MIRTFVLVIWLITGLSIQAFAQGVCVPAILKTKGVSGRVIATYSKGEESLEGARITVHKWHDQGPVVAKAISDASGKFRFQKIRPGKYAIVVERAPYVTFVVPVDVYRSSGSVNRAVDIIVNLGADHGDSCGGGYAELRKR